MLTINKKRFSNVVPDRLREIFTFIDATVEEGAKTFNISESYMRSILNGNATCPEYIEKHLIDIGINQQFLYGKSKVYIIGSKKELSIIRNYCEFKSDLKNSFLEG